MGKNVRPKSLYPLDRMQSKVEIMSLPGIYQ